MQNNFIRLYSDSCHLCVFKKIKTHKLLYAILILKMEEEKSNIYGVFCFIIWRKVKNTTKTCKKDLYSVWNWSNVSKVACEVSC